MSDRTLAFRKSSHWPRARALRLTPGAGEALFTIGRLAGWLAHAIEEYRAPTELRRRAVYTGPSPL